MLVHDYKYKINKAQLDFLAQRASPNLFNNYKLSKLYTTPFVLFHESLIHAITDKRPKFF